MQWFTDECNNVSGRADPIGEASDGNVNAITFFPCSKQTNYPIAFEPFVEDAGQEVDVLNERRLEYDTDITGVEESDGEWTCITSVLFAGNGELYLPALQVDHQEEYQHCCC